MVLIQERLKSSNRSSLGKFSNFSNTNTHNSGVNTHNMYNINDKLTLEDAQCDTEMEESPIATKKNVARERKKKVAPVVIVGSSASTVQNLLNEKITSKKFEIKLMRVGIRINLAEQQDFDLLCTALKEKTMNYYTYHTPETRPRKIVLFGLHQMSTDDLKGKLAELNVVPKDIKQLRLGRSRTDADNAAYLLYFDSGTTKLADLRKVRHIDNVIVRWENYQPKTYDQVPQCRTCQMFGHSSVNCNMLPRCLLCAGDHKTESCEKRVPRATLQHQQQTSGQQPDRSFVKCVNCNGQHTSNYRGCSSRKEFMDIQESLNHRRHQPRRQQPKPRTFTYNDEEFPDFGSNIRSAAMPGQTQNWGQQFRTPHSTPEDQMQVMMKMMCSMNELMSKLFQLVDTLTSRLGSNSLPATQ